MNSMFPFQKHVVVTNRTIAKRPSTSPRRLRKVLKSTVSHRLLPSGSIAMSRRRQCLVENNPEPLPGLRHAHGSRAVPPNAATRFVHRVARKQARQHARTVVHHSGNCRSLGPLRETIAPNAPAGSGTPISRSPFVPIDAIRDVLKMTKIRDKSDLSSNTPKSISSQPTNAQTRDRARSDPGRYGALEVVTRDKYHVP